MRLKAAVGGVFWSTTVLCSAAFGHDVLGDLHRRHHDVALINPRHHDVALNIRARLVKRDSTGILPTPTSTQQKADVFGASVWPTISIPAGFTLAAGVEITPMPEVAISAVTGTAALASALSSETQIADPATWNQQVETACQSKIDSLSGQAGNPSGMVACYNIAYLDTSRGRFEADLRIFNVSSETGDFANVPEGDMMVTLAYTNGQMVTNSSGTLQFPVKRSIEKRQSTGGVFVPVEVMSQKYIVQINNNSFTPGMNVSTFEALTIPNITISAQVADANNNANTTTLTTQLSPTQASYLVGIFVGNQSQSLTNPSYLLFNPAAKIEAAAQGLPTPFIVPGLSLGVFPVGLIVTGTWVLVFASVVGFGTMQRIRFRDQYRKDVKIQLDERIRRI